MKHARMSYPSFVLRLALVLAASQSVHAATIRVPDDHAKIQAAIDAAEPCDTIEVAPGTYNYSNTSLNYKYVKYLLSQGGS